MEFVSAGSVDEALDKLNSYGSDAAVLAGGTAVLYQLRSGWVRAKAVLHVETLADLSFVRSNGATEIGALTCLRALAESEELGDDYGAIRSAAASCGGWQTQSVATIGGNICNASPSADLVPPLLAHGARLTLTCQSRGSRSLPLADFLIGSGQTCREPDELLTAIALEAPAARTADLYVKVRRRSAMERPIIGLAVRLTVDEPGERIDDVRIAVCAAGPVPFRALEAEGILKGQILQDDAVKGAGAALVEQASVITDERASARYRQALLPRVLEHAVRRCAARASGAPSGEVPS
jgi:carbon-monoxide dehydrogenase medium subunit